MFMQLTPGFEAGSRDYLWLCPGVVVSETGCDLRFCDVLLALLNMVVIRLTKIQTRWSERFHPNSGVKLVKVFFVTLATWENTEIDPEK